MKTDQQLQDDVLNELRDEPQVDASEIGVSAKQGAVTLTGDVGNFDQKLKAVKAAQRVSGVSAVADELEVRYSGDPVDDADIAQAIADAFKSSATVPSQVKAEVKDGWVTLRGQVDWSFQRDDALAIVQGIRGVKGVTDELTLTPAALTSAVGKDIEEAFERSATLDARGVTVQAPDSGTVELHGHVRSLHEVDLAVQAAWAAPGVHEVRNLLKVTPWQSSD